MAAPVGTGPRRSWPQRLLLTFNVGLIVVCLVAAGGLGYFYWKFGQLPRVEIAENILAPEPEEPQEPQNFLLVGSDTRAFVEPGSQDDESFGDESVSGGSGRADTVIVLRVDPETEQAAMVSFPRDLWVQIPGRGSNRINTAFLGNDELSGPELLIETIKLNFNIPIHHYAQVDFKGFKGLVDAVGGITIYLPSPVRDYDAVTRQNLTGLNIAQTGCVELTGDQALAYVRSRHFQYQENGRWRADPTGDLGRITRQQDFIRRAINEAISRDLLDPRRLNDLINVATDNVQISRSIDIDDILALGKNFRSLTAEALQQYQLPVTNSRHGQASTLDILSKDRAEAEVIFDVFRGVPPAGAAGEPQPSAISVRVLNGSGVAGQAGEVAAALRQLQFGTTDPGNAQRIARTTIRYAPGQEAKAAVLARYLGSGAQLEEQSTLEGVDVLLITGADFTSVLAEPAAPPPTTTTTAPPPTETSTTATGGDPAVPAC
jgi:LCP family protein required for cell wall assembly